MLRIAREDFAPTQRKWGRSAISTSACWESATSVLKEEARKCESGDDVLRDILVLWEIAEFDGGQLLTMSQIQGQHLEKSAVRNTHCLVLRRAQCAWYLLAVVYCGAPKAMCIKGKAWSGGINPTYQKPLYLCSAPLSLAFTLTFVAFRF